MAPLTEALKTRFKGTEDGGSTLIYEGAVDPEWTIAAIPHGGYALCIILDAAIQAQASTSQPDVAHCTVHYLRSAMLLPYTVRIQRLKQGKGFSNITAELVQDGNVRISCHLIFTTLPDAPPSGLPTRENLTVTRPAPLARRMPIDVHPGDPKVYPTKLVEKFTFKDKMLWWENREFVERSKREKAASGEGGPEWTCWISLTDKTDNINTASLGFFADMFRNLPEMLPKDQKPGPSWFPTMVMAIEFKVKLSAIHQHAQRTVGLWSTGKFMQNGRHDNSVEVWTAPCEFGDRDAKISEDWRSEQHCLLISTQMALTLPLTVNEKRRARM